MMSEQLKQARARMDLAWETRPPSLLQVGWAVEMLVQHLHLEESKPQPASESSSSEISSAPTTGTAPTRVAWCSATPGVPTASLEVDQRRLVLTDEITGSSRSMSFTPGEWQAMCNLFSILPSTSVWHTPSTVTQAGGVRGVASHD